MLGGKTEWKNLKSRMPNIVQEKIDYGNGKKRLYIHRGVMDTKEERLWVRSSVNRRFFGKNRGRRPYAKKKPRVEKKPSERKVWIGSGKREHSLISRGGLRKERGGSANSESMCVALKSKWGKGRKSRSWEGSERVLGAIIRMQQKKEKGLTVVTD